MLAFFADETGEPWPSDPTAPARGRRPRHGPRLGRPPRRASSARPRARPRTPASASSSSASPLGIGPGLSGSGQLQAVDSRTGAPERTGGFRPQAQGAARLDAGSARPLEDLGPAALARARRRRRPASRALGDAHLIEFAVEDGALAVLDALPVRRTGRAAVRIAVDLVHAGAITRNEALLRIEPRSLIEHLHPQIDPGAHRDVFATGLAASPGAATGRVVFTADAAQSAAARGEPTILARTETSPEDIRGMHAASGVLTVHGGMSSHAAVIARGLGLPCVVGASESASIPPPAP